MKRRVAILISGRGSNMAALIKAAKAADFPAEIVARDFQQAPTPAASKRAQAQRHSQPLVIESKPFGKDRAGFEAVLQSALDENSVELICLGGFMRLFTAEFVQRWYGRMLNIHPSLLPSFPGLDPHGQALARRREDFRRHRAFRDPGNRCRPDRDAGRGRGRAMTTRRRRWRRASSQSSTASIPKRCGCSPAARFGSRAISAGFRGRRRRTARWFGPTRTRSAPHGSEVGRATCGSRTTTASIQSQVGTVTD